MKRYGLTLPIVLAMMSAMSHTERLPGYPGGKSMAGVYHRLINLMPPHDTYIEPFLGAGGVMRMKRPAALNIGVDLNGGVIDRWKENLDIAPSSLAGRTSSAFLPVAPIGRNAGNGGGRRRATFEVTMAAGHVENGGARAVYRIVHGDGLEFLRGHKFAGRELVYCDPPYLMYTRSGEPLYANEMGHDAHRELLKVLNKLPCPVLLSGYWSPLYAELLERKKWREIHYNVMTRGGLATEWLWCNFPPPLELHDYRYCGSDYREREAIKRKSNRWAHKLASLPDDESALLSLMIRADYRDRERIKRKMSRWTSRLNAMGLVERRALLWAISTAKNGGTAGSGVAVRNGDAARSGGRKG